MEINFKDGMENMDFEKITSMLARSSWSLGIGIQEIKKAASNSAMVVGAYDNGKQIGYGRVISDKTRFAYLTDFYIDDSYRKMGIGQKMVSYIINHPEFADVYQWLLKTKDAHDVYRKQGFEVISRPLDHMEILSPRPNR